jgi:large subunit ribosomal protein L19
MANKKDDKSAAGPAKIAPINREERAKLDVRAGDTVKVYQRIQEKGKIRLQIFEGLVLARKHGTEAGSTFTVRKVSQGVGVERIFPIFSPMIEKVEIVRRAKVRRAKLYYIRDKAAKEISRQMRNASVMRKEEAVKVPADASEIIPEADSMTAETESVAV